MSTFHKESPDTQCVLSVRGLRHTLSDKEKDEHFTIYVEQSLEFLSGDFVGLLGPSGCGKTTLLTLLGLLREPSHPEEVDHFKLHAPPEEGKDLWEEIDLAEAWRKGKINLIEKLRRQHFGFALQSGELISSLTVRENIALPLILNGSPSRVVNDRVSELVRQFKLSRIREQHNLTEQKVDNPLHRNALANARINRLSGGEYQRVALARAIAHHPSVVFVDEPTSALNRKLAHGALTAMKDLQQNRKNAGITFMITHDETLADEFCNVIVRMMPRSNEPAGEVTDVTRNNVAAENNGEIADDNTNLESSLDSVLDHQ